MVEAVTPQMDALRADLEVARADLLAAVEGISAQAFVRTGEAGDPRSVRDVLWEAGQVEDWYRRTIDQAVGGRAVDAFVLHPRPERLATPDYLFAWVEQTRRPLLSLLRRLTEADLAAEVRAPGVAPRTVQGLLERLAADEREHAKRVRALRASVDTGGGD
ncbi:MAG: DinB family protein [Dehalococcoidia bacterium]|nr:DinB family protein [Dehalococcoidia bacterium]